MRRLAVVRRALIAVFALGLIASTGVFIWPTPYRSVPAPKALSTLENDVLGLCCYGARAHRRTGKVELLSAFGWTDYEGVLRLNRTVVDLRTPAAGGTSLFPSAAGAADTVPANVLTPQEFREVCRLCAGVAPKTDYDLRVRSATEIARACAACGHKP